MKKNDACQSNYVSLKKIGLDKLDICYCCFMKQNGAHSRNTQSQTPQIKLRRSDTDSS
jgi:hypothetical protein